MAVDVEALVAHEANKRHAGFQSEIDRERRGRGHGRDDRNAGHGSFLHDLDTTRGH